MGSLLTAPIRISWTLKERPGHIRDREPPPVELGRGHFLNRGETGLILRHSDQVDELNLGWLIPLVAEQRTLHIQGLCPQSQSSSREGAAWSSQTS